MLAVAAVVLEYLARQLGVEDPSCVGRYLERRRTRFEHAEEIKLASGLSEFADARSEFDEWVAARAWMTGDGPRSIFADAVAWLRDRDVLLPGVTTLTRLVARARADGDERLWETLAELPSAPERMMLEGLLEVGEGSRFSDLERWRKGPGEPSGKSLRLTLQRVAEIHGLGVDGARVRELVPARRLVDLARYGMAAKAPRLRRHPPARTIRDQRAGIEAAFRNGLSNARVEQINTQIRLITRRGFGYHSQQAVIALAMLSLSGLCPPLPGR